MRFSPVKRHRPPSVIIVSLIDVLLVVLIFIMVATTFKPTQQPAIKLALPESSQTNQAPAQLESLLVTVAPEPPHLYLNDRPITYQDLRAELTKAVGNNPEIKITLRADENAPFGQIVKVMDAARENGIKGINAFTKQNAQP
jgi:biopolymer transport protein ExbD